jgi:hypothetical protein
MRGAMPPVSHTYLWGLYLITHRQNLAFSLLNFEDNIELAMHILTVIAKPSSGVPANLLGLTRGGRYILVKRKTRFRNLRHLRECPQGQRHFRTIAASEIEIFISPYVYVLQTELTACQLCVSIIREWATFI